MKTREGKLIEEPAYLETLPGECPPLQAVDVALVDVWRFVENSYESTEALDMAAFHSHAQKGFPTGNASECEARSCSLWTHGSVESARKLPKLRALNMVRLNIPIGNGRSLVNQRRGHIHFWMFNSCVPFNCAIELVKKSA